MKAFFRWIGLFFILGSLFPLSIGHTQTSPVLTITHVDTSAYPQVKLLISAPNGALPDPASLQITEDRKAIAAEEIEANAERTGVAVAVVIDTSRSMRGRGMPESADRLEDAREQAIALAKALDFDTDLISIFAFHRDVVPIMPLSRVDGGAVENSIKTSDVLGEMPIQPTGNRRPTDEELRNDERAFSAFSQTISRAIDELNNPQTSDAYIRENLPLMQKVIIVFADSCDDTLDARGSKTCSIPLDVQTKLQDVVRSGNLSIFSVGLGSPVENQALPKPPQRAEPGFLYAARFELLQLYAQQIPHSRFFQFYTADPAASATVREEFKTQMIDPIISRGNQIAVSYASQVGSAGQQRQIVVSDGTLQVASTFEEPRIPPLVAVIAEESNDRLIIRPEIIYSQSPLARVDYYVNNNSVPLPGDPPTFALDWSGIEPGLQQIAVEATDQRGERSLRSAAIELDIPVAPAPERPFVVLPPDEEPTFLNQLNRFILNNVISLITLLLVIILAIVVLVNPRGRAAASQMTSRVTGVIQRMTRPISATSAVSAANADFVLVVQQGGITGTEYPLANLNTYVGADPSLVDIVLDDPHVSGRHASINREENDLYVTDLGSTNGTYINRNPLTPNARVQLHAKDQLTIGGITLECIWRGGVPTSMTPNSVEPSSTVVHANGNS
ncbi:FHA domain-containing protein [Candidatus Chloroploca asiatica]|uniref:FHA domain-containing protein n=1 Tax=Candidatus Chloroploca asiatica TaxID=1506545 RepID=A0A2H3KW16_9CHLR|nr:FHA domain-containing protein [Candidatus Chloroploca asiatica]PDV98101.1 hypothetical protein A9Q02_03200 [Candidatus Chloroploca asiatica]